MEDVWQSRPIFLRLPDAYQQALLIDALTIGADEILTAYRGIIFSLPSQFDPVTAPADNLDTIAIGLPTSVFVEFWDSAWTESLKRSLLLNQDYLVQWRGDLKCFAKLLELLPLEGVSILPLSGLILGVTELPSSLGASPFDYQIRVPSRMGVGTYERALIERAIDWALSGWLKLSIVEY